MGILALLAASLFVAPSRALDAASGTPAAQSPAKDEFEQVRADLRKAFETARPVSPQLRQVLAQLAEKPAAPGAAPEEAARRREEADELQVALEEILVLQKGGVEPDKKMSSDLAKRVGKVCDAVRVDEEPRRAAALDLYLSRWQSGRADLTPEKAVEERKLAQENLKKSMSAQTGSQGRANARLRDLAAFRPGSGPGSGPSVAATTVGGGAVAASAGRPTPGNSMTSEQLKALKMVGRVGPSTLKTHPVPPPSKAEEPSLFGFVKDYSQGLSEHLYGGEVDVIAQRQQTKDSRTEHSAIMYRLQDYNSRHYSDPTAKTAIDVSVGAAATIMYNIPFGFALGVYQSVTGDEAPGLGLLGHAVVGISDYSLGNEKSARDHFKTGWDDIVGDLQGIVTKVKDNYGDKRTN